VYSARSVSGTDGHRLAALEVLQAARLLQREVDLRRVEQVHHDQLVAAVAQLQHGVDRGARLV
jgi:hypothetical protein